MAAVDASPPGQNLTLGILLRLGAATCFAFMGAMIKLGYEAGVTTPELVFYRFALGLPLLLAWMTWTGNYGAWRTRRPMAHVWRAVVGLSTMAVAFSALAYLPLAEATTIGFAAPLFAVALSALVLKEPVGRYRWSAVAVGFLGVLVVMRPAGADLSATGVTLALLAALGVGAVTITIRQIGRTEGTQTTVLWFTILSMLAAGALMPFFASAHAPATWAVLCALGLFGGLAQLLLTAALRYAPVAVIAPFDYSQLLWAILIGWAIWSTQPPPSTLAGAAIIIASGLYTLYREQRLGLKNRRAEEPPL